MFCTLSKRENAILARSNLLSANPLSFVMTKIMSPLVKGNAAFNFILEIPWPPVHLCMFFLEFMLPLHCTAFFQSHQLLSHMSFVVADRVGDSDISWHPVYVSMLSWEVRYNHFAPILSKALAAFPLGIWIGDPQVSRLSRYRQIHRGSEKQKCMQESRYWCETAGRRVDRQTYLEVESSSTWGRNNSKSFFGQSK